jgi:DNA repair protein RadC
VDEEAILAKARFIIRSRWPASRRVVAGAQDAFAALEIHYGNRSTEAVTLVLLDAGNGLIGITDISEGTVDGAYVFRREVVRSVLDADATGVILAHNHPSGRTQPSEADRQLTRRIGDALRAIDVRLLDHVVCGAGDFYSFADHREASLTR